LKVPGDDAEKKQDETENKHHIHTEAVLRHGSLSSLTSRPPDLRLGIGLPMSRIYSGMLRSDAFLCYCRRF
jgi:hypothetical protein